MERFTRALSNAPFITIFLTIALVTSATIPLNHSHVFPCGVGLADVSAAYQFASVSAWQGLLHVAEFISSGRLFAHAS
jgi:hypothetical protein